MALGMGMHREISGAGQDCLAFEQRRQIFWTLFCFDVGVSITTGRPATIVDSFVDVKAPRNIDDSVGFNSLIGSTYLPRLEPRSQFSNPTRS